MKKMRFTATLLCLTMVFAMFTGGAYAQSLDSVYIEETTIVVKDGKVVSGDASLVDRGFIVIGDAVDTADDNGEGIQEEYPEEDNYSSPIVNSSTGKAPVKDNSSFISPESSTGISSGVALPSEIPYYTAPTGYVAPTLSFNSADAVITEGISDNWSPRSAFELTILHTARRLNSSGKSITIDIANATRGWRGETMTSGNVNFTGSFFIVDNGSMTIKNGAGSDGTRSGKVTLDGLRLYYNTYSGRLSYANNKICWSNDTTPTGYPGNQVAWGVEASKYPFKPILVVNNGTMTVDDPNGVSIVNNLSSEKGSAAQVNGGTLNLTNVTIKRCKANGNGGAIYIGANGKAVLNNCTISDCISSGDGGAIYVASGGKLTLTSTTINNCNASKNGGAIYLAGDATLSFTSVTISNNKANARGGGLYVANGTHSFSANIQNNTADGDGTKNNGNTAGWGGGIFVSAGNVTYSGGTMSGNYAEVDGGGICCTGGTATISGGTIRDNNADQGGGAYVSGAGTLIMTNGTLTSNDSGAGVFMYNGSDFTMSGGTISSNTPCGGYEGGGVAIFDNKDGTFRMTGGTISGHSGAKGHGIGQTITSGSTNAGGTISIEGGTISGNTPSSDGGGIYITAGTLNISGGNIGASGSGNTAAHGAGVLVGSGVTATFTGGTFRDNKADVHGGAVYVQGTLNVSGVTFNNCDSVSDGGAIYLVAAASLSYIRNSTFTDCDSPYGGGVYLQDRASGSTLTIDMTSVNFNKCDTLTTSTGGNGNGGAMWVGTGYTVNYSGDMTENTATGLGGAVAVARPATFNFLGGSITGNKAPYGGAIACYSSANASGSTFNMTGGTLSNNEASIKGGAIYIDCGSGHSISGGTIANNESPLGAGIYVFYDTRRAGAAAGKVTISGSAHLYKNGHGTSTLATNDGGGVHVSSGGTLVMSGGTIGGDDRNTHGNGGVDGAGVYVNGGTFTMSGGTIKNNVGTYGAGVYLEGTSTFNMSGAAKINNNYATNQGGGLFATGAYVLNVTGSTTAGNCTINGNTATNHGGGLFLSTCTTPDNVKLNNLTISDNTSKTNRGGGVYVNFAEANKANKLRISGATISNNVAEEVDSADTNAEGHGGGVYLIYATLLVDNTTFSDNSATVRGGGLYCTAASTATVTNCTFTENESKGIQNNSACGRGGALYLYDGAKVTVINSSFNDNSANTHCGAIGLDGEDTDNTICYLDLIDVNVGNTTANTASQNGGGMFIGDRAVVNIVRGNISNNSAANGGGIYIEDYATSTGTVVKISDNTGILSTVPSGVSTTAAATVISNNTATTGNGGGVFVKNVSNCTITNANIYGNTAMTDIRYETEFKYASASDVGMGGGVFAYGDTTNLTLSGVTVGKEGSPNFAAYGGGVAVLWGASVTADNVTANYNKALKAGGGYYLLSFVDNVTNSDNFETVLDINGGSINYNRVTFSATDSASNLLNTFKFTEGTTEKDISSEIGGGAVYARSYSGYKKAELYINDAEIASNYSHHSAGGVYVHEATDAVIENCDFISNHGRVVTGAFYFPRATSTAQITNCDFIGNNAGVYGGAMYIGGNGVTVSSCSFTENFVKQIWQSHARGGAIYASSSSDTNYPVTLYLNSCDFIGNYAQDALTPGGAHGGALFVEGSAAALKVILDKAEGGSPCKLVGNYATGNGGAIGITQGSSTVEMKGGYIVANHAGNNTTEVNDSPYQKLYNKTAGAGGGVAVFTGGKFTFSGNGAIYGNLAATAGNDVFSNGYANPKVTVIPISEMTEYTAALPNGIAPEVSDYFGSIDFEEELNWYEDYMTGDANYGQGLNGNSSYVFRYKDTPFSVLAPVAKISSEDYVSITIGVAVNNTGFITISVPASEGIDPNQRFVYVVTGMPLEGDEYTLTVSLAPGESVKITGLIAGTYRIEQKTSWAWRYKTEGISYTGGQSQSITGDVIEFYLACVEDSDNVAVTFNNGKVNVYWLDHNSPVQTNKATATAVAAVSFDAAEFKKNNVL